MDSDATTSALGDADGPTIDDTAPPARVGRHVLDQELGRGGFGVVYAALDPELDRRVAIKLLRRGAALDEEALRRFKREARALAALQHPNVVGVFDVGRIDGPWGSGLFIVMELVEGQSLHQWLEARPRSIDETLAVLCEAGRGLAAAHAAGIVHRDFKPGNVLLGREGAVKVADFGLARATADDDPSHDVAEDASAPARVDDSDLEIVTRRGVVMGTPRYMAPEQLELGGFDTRTDQFAFCVTAWEALTGVAPFPSATDPKARLAAIRAETIATGRPLPARIARALRRGMAHAPTQRHASMQALLDRLSPSRARGRRPLVLAAALAGASVGVVGLASWWATDPAPVECAAVEARLAGIWDDATRHAVHEAFVDTRLTYAPALADRVVQRLDAHAARWADAWQGACDAITTHGGDAQVDRRLGCLREHLDQLTAVGEALAHADAAVVPKSAGMVETLADPAACEATQEIRAWSPTERRSLETIRADLARARVQAEAGRFEAALETIDRAHDALAEASDSGALVEIAALEIEAERGVVLDRAGRYAEAAERMATTYFAAVDAGLVDVAARLATELVVVHGYHLGKPDEGLRWARHADTETQRAGNPVRARAMLDANLGIVHFAAGELEPAIASLSRAASGFEELGEAGRTRLARTLQNLASVQLMHGEGEAAVQSLQRSLEHTRRTQGPAHPDLTAILTNLGIALSQQGDLAGALAHQQQALAIATAALGPEHPTTLATRTNVGERLIAVGRADEAVPLLETTLVVRRRELGSDHPDVARTLNNLGLALERLGRHDEAIDRLSEALAILEAQPGAHGGDLGRPRYNLGEACLHAQRFDDAQHHLERALQTFERAAGPDDPALAFPLTALGELALARGEPDRAVPWLERAHRLREQGPRDPHEKARTAFALARALVAAEADGADDGDAAERVTELVALAERELLRAGEGHAETLAELRRWRRRRARDTSPRPHVRAPAP